MVQKGEEKGRRKRGIIFGEGKYMVDRGEEKQKRKKVENIWKMKRRKIFGPQRRRKTEKEKEEIF